MGGKRKRGRKEREEGGERSSTLSLEFSMIEPSAFVGARNQADPHSESYMWVPKSGSFEKIEDVGVFLLLGLILI